MPRHLGVSHDCGLRYGQRALEMLETTANQGLILSKLTQSLVECLQLRALRPIGIE